MRIQDIQMRDPFVLPVPEEGIYYLFGSTDKNIWKEGKGFDVYTSRDLENWEGPIPVFRRPDGYFSELNFWAPEVHRRHGRYYMFATFRRKDNNLLGTAILSAEQPTGPFTLHSSGPVTPEDWTSLDGTLYVDDEDQPWMVFCHEWQQVGDGEICAMRLTPDLTAAASEPVVLFRASESGWAHPIEAPRYPDRDNYVTDGPFLFRSASGSLFMLWASFMNGHYAQGIAKSVSGWLEGPWEHESKPLYDRDGGHGMLFRTWDGQLMLTVHAPNRTPDERPVFLRVQEDGDQLRMLPAEQQEA